jgi:hypothetical protein
MTHPSYAVVWQEGGGPVRPGRLVLGPVSLELETGAPGGRMTAWILRYADLASVEKAGPRQRLHNRPTTVLKRRDREPLAIAALEGLGFGHEIVERLAALVPESGQAAS